MTERVNEGASFDAINVTSTTTFTGSGSMIGISVASCSNTPTIKLQDGSRTLLNTRALTAGEFITFPTRWGTSLVVTIGGTVDCSVHMSRN